MCMAFGHVEIQTAVAVGKGQIHLAVAEAQLEGDWGWLGQRDQ